MESAALQIPPANIKNEEIQKTLLHIDTEEDPDIQLKLDAGHVWI